MALPYKQIKRSFDVHIDIYGKYKECGLFNKGNEVYINTTLPIYSCETIGVQERMRFMSTKQDIFGMKYKAVEKPVLQLICPIKMLSPRMHLIQTGREKYILNLKYSILSSERIKNG